MTEEIVEQNKINSYFKNDAKNRLLVKNLVNTFENSLQQFLSNEVKENKKLAYDSLLLQVIQVIEPSNLKYFLKNKATIEKLLKTISSKYKLGLLEVLLRSRNLQNDDQISSILWA